MLFVSALMKTCYLSFAEISFSFAYFLRIRSGARNDKKCIFRSLRAIRRIARQSQNVSFGLWQQTRKRESRFIVRSGFRIKACPEQTKACPELAVALSEAEGVAEWGESVRNDNTS